MSIAQVCWSRKWTLQLTLKRQKWRLVFYLDCFGDRHIDFLLQVVFCSSTRTWLIKFSVDGYHRIFEKNFFLVMFTHLRVGDIIHSLYLLEKKGHHWSSSFKSEIHQAMIWNKILPKYAIEMCQIMKIGQIVVFNDLSDTRLSVPARRPSPSSNGYLNLVSVCFKWYGRNH